VKRKSTRLILALALLIPLFPLPDLQAEEGGKALSARDIVMASREKQFPENSVMDITMVLINKRGNKRTRKIETKRKTLGDGEAKSVAYFLSPADVKGTAFLVWEHKEQDNDVFIYLPALKKIRRIASDQKNQSFMGSDFSYSDMEKEDVDDATHKILTEETLEGTPCWVIESIPKPESDSEYSKVLTWVTKDQFIPEKMELYDKKGKLYKIMDVARSGPVGDKILILDFSMENVKKKHKTQIVLDNVKLDQTIPDSVFTHRAIQRR
jgi:outer membrane lipoprotein-sorting protein